MPLLNQAWVFAGGEFAKDQCPMDQIKQDDLIVCVDGGVVHCLEVGLLPDLWVGDFDSTPTKILHDDRLAGVERRHFPSMKASSDLQLTLEILESLEPRVVTIFGVSGGRTDHMLFNWFLPLLKQWPFKLQLIDHTMHAYVLAGSDDVSIKVVKGYTISLVALSKTEGVTTSGLQYALHDAVIDPGSTLGLSNVVDEPNISVEINSGTLLVMVQRTIQENV